MLLQHRRDELITDEVRREAAELSFSQLNRSECELNLNTIHYLNWRRPSERGSEQPRSEGSADLRIGLT